MSSADSPEDRAFLNRAVETTIRIGLIALIVVWCFQIVRPFVQPIVWGVILAIALHPAYVRIARAAGGRENLAAAALVIGILLLLIVPAALITTNLVESATALAGRLEAGELDVPPPNASVADWPVIGGDLYAFWWKASESLGAALTEVAPQLQVVGQWILGMAATAGLGVVMFGLSIVIAGVFLAQTEPSSDAARSIARRLVGERGDKLVELMRATVMSVTRGILGVALIQALLAGVGLIAAGVPAAGLWTLLVLVVAVVQIPAALVLLPIVVYVFSVSSTFVAVTFAIWSLLVGFSDNLLKPVLLGRGLDVPMLVIFMGAIGGFILDGIIGLFVGAVVLAVGYKLFNMWLEQPAETTNEVAG